MKRYKKQINFFIKKQKDYNEKSSILSILIYTFCSKILTGSYTFSNKKLIEENFSKNFYHKTICDNWK